MMDVEARREALDCLHGGREKQERVLAETIEQAADIGHPLPLDLEVGTIIATPRTQFIGDRLKPLHYALVAECTDELVKSFTSYPPQHPLKPVSKPNFMAYQGATQNALKQYLDAFDTPAFKFHRDIASLRADLLGRIQMGLSDQLAGGIDTASSVIFHLLRELPVVIKALVNENSEQQLQIIRRSGQLANELAGLSIPQFMAAQKTFEGLNPFILGRSKLEYYKIVERPSGLRVIFNNLGGIAVSAELVAQNTYAAVNKKLSEIDDTMPDFGRHIGCPITLIPGLTDKLWQWAANVATNAGLL